MRQIYLLFALTILTVDSLAQLDTISIQNDTINYDSDYDIWNTGLTFTIQTGVWIPLGNLSKTLGTSPSVGFLWGTAISKNYRFDIGSFLFIPISYEKINLHLPDTVLKAKPTLSGTVLGIWVTHSNQISSKYFIDRITGIGLGVIQTDQLDKNSKEGLHHNLETINLSLGFNIRRIVLSKRSVGVNMTYNFTPYSLFQDYVGKEFGSHSLSTGFVYKF